MAAPGVVVPRLTLSTAAEKIMSVNGNATALNVNVKIVTETSENVTRGDVSILFEFKSTIFIFKKFFLQVNSPNVVPNVHVRDPLKDVGVVHRANALNAAENVRVHVQGRVDVQRNVMPDDVLNVTEVVKRKRNASGPKTDHVIDLRRNVIVVIKKKKRRKRNLTLTRLKSKKSHLMVSLC